MCRFKNGRVGVALGESAQISIPRSEMPAFWKSSLLPVMMLEPNSLRILLASSFSIPAHARTWSRSLLAGYRPMSAPQSFL
jgi:hypothetical protein